MFNDNDNDNDDKGINLFLQNRTKNILSIIYVINDERSALKAFILYTA